MEKKRILFSVWIDDGVVHQACSLQSEIDALVLVKHLGLAISKTGSDWLDKLERGV